MTEPIEELYCADCRQRVYVDRIPVRNAGSQMTQYINGRIRCLTSGCLAQSGVTDREGNAVAV